MPFWRVAQVRQPSIETGWGAPRSSSLLGTREGCPNEGWPGRRDPTPFALFQKSLQNQQSGRSFSGLIPGVIRLWLGFDHGSECHQTHRSSEPRLSARWSSCDLHHYYCRPYDVYRKQVDYGTFIQSRVAGGLADHCGISRRYVPFLCSAIWIAWPCLLLGA